MEAIDNPKYLELMSKYLSGNIAPAERKDLLGWADSSSDNKAFFDEMVQLWSLSGDYKEEQMEVDIDAAWENVIPKLDEPEIKTIAEVPVIPINKQRSKIISLFSSVRGIAASIAVLLVAGFLFTRQFYQPNLKAEITGLQEKKEILLPDGSKVILNQNSTLKYSPKFAERKVVLEGEAYFDVASMPNRPFTIEAQGMKTEVLGTEFNVRAYPEEEEVQVIVDEGLVEISPVSKPRTKPVQRSLKLKRGQSGLLKKEAQEIVEVKEPELLNLKTIWKNTTLEFDETPLPEAVMEIEAYFDIKIEVDEEKFRNCPVSFEISDPKLNDILLILEDVNDNRYKIDPLSPNKTYTIKGKNCD